MNTKPDQQPAVLSAGGNPSVFTDLFSFFFPFFFTLLQLFFYFVGKHFLSLSGRARIKTAPVADQLLYLCSSARLLLPRTRAFSEMIVQKCEFCGEVKFQSIRNLRRPFSFVLWDKQSASALCGLVCAQTLFRCNVTVQKKEERNMKSFNLFN